MKKIAEELSDDEDTYNVLKSNCYRYNVIN